MACLPRGRVDRDGLFIVLPAERESSGRGTHTNRGSVAERSPVLGL